MRQNKLILIIGAPRSGKSFFANSICERYIKGGGSAIVYGVGMYTDFECLKLAELSYSENKRNINLDGFVLNNKLYKPESMFLPGAGLKFTMDADDKLRNVFYSQIQRNALNSFVVFDDAKRFTRHGMSKQLEAVVCAINHTGKHNSMVKFHRTGSDFAFMFHSILHCNPGFWAYATDLVLFRVRSKLVETGDKEKDEEIYNLLTKLDELPQYSYIHLNLIDFSHKIFAKK